MESVFSLSSVYIIVEERHQYHQNRYNKNKTNCNFKIDDVFKARMQVNSLFDKGVVSRLSYKAKVPFTITANLGHNSYEVQRYNYKNSAKQKYKSTELNLPPPPILFSSKSLDSIDQRYLDSRHAPIVDPLKVPLRVKIYNDKWLRSQATYIHIYSSIID